MGTRLTWVTFYDEDVVTAVGKFREMFKDSFYSWAYGDYSSAIYQLIAVELGLVKLEG